MDITVTLDRDDLYTAVADYLTKHGQSVDGATLNMNIKAGRGVAEADIAATVILSTKAPKAPAIQQEEAPVVEPKPKVVDPTPTKEARKLAKVAEKAEEDTPPFDDDSGDQAKKSLFDDPKGREPAPTNPLFGS